MLSPAEQKLAENAIWKIFGSIKMIDDRYRKDTMSHQSYMAARERLREKLRDLLKEI